MPWQFDCPRIGRSVELTDERFAHIAEQHPELLPVNLPLIAETLADPDGVVPGRAGNELVFRRWYDSLYGGKNVLVFILKDEGTERHWMVTARVSRVRGRRGTQ